jgi:hypothetical protein
MDVCWVRCLRVDEGRYSPSGDLCQGVTNKVKKFVRGSHLPALASKALRAPSVSNILFTGKAT